MNLLFLVTSLRQFAKAGLRNPYAADDANTNWHILPPLQNFQRSAFDQAHTPAVFGYFAGGGWAFGLVEGAGYRITKESFDRYENAKTGDKITIDFYGNDDPNDILPGRSITLTVDGSGGPGFSVPSFANLVPLDQFSETHDQEIRGNTVMVWTALASGIYVP